jgi:hypothetical protein
MAGLLALLDYIWHFNVGGVKREGVPKKDEWASSPHQWPTIEVEEGERSVPLTKKLFQIGGHPHMRRPPTEQNMRGCGFSKRR